MQFIHLNTVSASGCSPKGKDITIKLILTWALNNPIINSALASDALAVGFVWMLRIESQQRNIFDIKYSCVFSF